MKQTVWVRSASLGLGVVLAIYAVTNLLAEITRPAFGTSEFFSNSAGSVAAENPATSIAAVFSDNGDFLADDASVKTRKALDARSSDPAERTADNNAAERSLLSTLSVSPIRSATWLMLGILRNQTGGAATGPVKMSYLTGLLPLDIAFSRIQTVSSTSVVSDEDVRLLASSDVRAILSQRARYEAPLVATYVQATPEGKKFLLDASETADPKFADILRRY